MIWRSSLANDIGTCHEIKQTYANDTENAIKKIVFPFNDNDILK